MKSDTLEIKLDDREPPRVIPPEERDEFYVSMGYKETGVAPMGIFVVDEINYSGPVRELTVRARATDMVANFKAPRTKEWGDTTISAVVEEIAGRHGYIPKVGGEVAAIQLPHLNQTEESDMHLLTRLAEEYGAVFKPVYKTLVFMPPGEAKSASGRDLPTVMLTKKDIQRWNTILAKRGKYKSVRARWRDIEKGEDVEVTIGGGDPEFLLRNTYPNHELAKAAAQSKYDALQRGVGTINLTVEGDVRLGAEGKVEINNLRGANGTWVIEQAVHTITKKDGYKCDIEGAVPK
jgi:phage protein D